MAVYTDQLNRTIELAKKPERIISIVPSQTELLFDLGLDHEVVGITKFCIHPSRWFREKTRVGGTKTLHLEKIRHLNPDLIIANKEENVQEQVEKLADEFPVWISDVNDLDQAYEMIESIGKITGRNAAAKKLSAQIQSNFHLLSLSDKKLRSAYLIWKDPYMTAGGDTFIHSLLTRAGFDNIFKNKKRYPVITVEDLRLSSCELLLLSSEPYPFKEKHIEDLQAQLPGTRILLVDGEMFSWYGSRLLHAPLYFQNLQRQIMAIM